MAGESRRKVVAITNIESTYRVEKNWHEDPCAPQDCVWKGLNYSSDDLLRITSLNLSSSGLTGEISSYISNLDMLQPLDLSNNSLTGLVPEFLSKLPNLKVLSLEKNMLNGSVPARLIEKVTSGSLSLMLFNKTNWRSGIKKEKAELVIIKLEHFQFSDQHNGLCGNSRVGTRQHISHLASIKEV